MKAKRPLAKITCPHTWDCGRVFAPDQLSKSDFDFLQAATKIRMSFMFINCPECGRRIQFDTVHWKSTPTVANPNRKIPKKISPEKAEALLRKSKVSLPAAYRQFLEDARSSPKITFVRRGNEFRLYTLPDLAEKVTIDGKTYLRASELKGYAKSLAKVSDPEAQSEISLKTLSQCISIGCENTQILFLDSRDQNTLWIFHPDGGDIERTTLTLAKLRRKLIN